MYVCSLSAVRKNLASLGFKQPCQTGASVRSSGNTGFAKIRNALSSSSPPTFGATIADSAQPFAASSK